MQSIRAHLNHTINAHRLVHTRNNTQQELVAIQLEIFYASFIWRNNTWPIKLILNIYGSNRHFGNTACICTDTAALILQASIQAPLLFSHYCIISAVQMVWWIWLGPQKDYIFFNLTEVYIHDVAVDTTSMYPLLLTSCVLVS